MISVVRFLSFVLSLYRGLLEFAYVGPDLADLVVETYPGWLRHPCDRPASYFLNASAVNSALLSDPIEWIVVTYSCIDGLSATGSRRRRSTSRICALS